MKYIIKQSIELLDKSGSSLLFIVEDKDELIDILKD
jgi:hypothetical protein